MKRTGYPSIDRLHEEGHSFIEKHPIIPGISIYNMMRMSNILYGKRPAIDCLELKMTYKELFKMSKIISKAFKTLEVKENDIIIISMPNYAQAIAIFLAANRIGATVSILNPGCTTAEIKQYISLFKSKILINFNKSKDYNKKMKADTKIKHIITLEKEDVNKKEFITNANVKQGSHFISFSELGTLAKQYKKHIKTMYGKKQNALILFTSGSTGTPKSVVLTNQNIIASGIYMKNTGRIKAKKGEKCLVCVPFGYPYGFSTSALMTLLCGREAILEPNLDHTNVNEALRKGPNYIFGSPAVLEMMRRSTEEDVDLSKAHSFVSGGDFLTPEEALRGIEFFKEHGAKIEFYNGSGNAESAATNTMAVGSKIRRETVGKPLVGSTAIVIDPETKEEKKYGEIGILCISGKHIFKEYYNEPEITQEAILMYKGERFLNTGAMGFLDKQGYFTMTGRKSRFKILSDGNKLYPEHLKQFLSKVECVEKCAAVAKPNEKTLWESKAYVVLKPEYKPTKKQADLIIKELNEMVSKSNNKTTRNLLKTFEIPKSITFVDEIPLLPSDKEDYNLLEKWAKQEYKEEKEGEK